MAENKDALEQELLQRIKEAKKSDEIYKKSGVSEQQMIRPRRKKPEEEIESNKKTQFTPKQPHVTIESQSDIVKHDIIKPRRKSQQNTSFVNVDKEELTKTVTEVTREWKELDKVTKKEEKKLTKEKNQIEKKVVKLQHKLEKMVEHDQFTEELTHTLEIQDNYMAAMQEINEHIQKINTEYGPEISLADRRKQIYENSKLAATERAQRLMYIRKLESEGKSLSKGNAPSINKSTFFQRQLEQQKNMDFLKQRDPYHQRLFEVNERGGVTVDETRPLDDHVAQRWNERKGNYDKNGKLKPKDHFEFPKE